MFIIAEMSKITNKILQLFPSGLQQIIRNTYYKIKFINARWEHEKDLFIVEKVLRENMVAVDVGANYGLYSKFMSQFVGSIGTVYAFEPILKTFISLSNNVKGNRYSNIKIFNSALSDKEGKVEMVIPNYESGGENLYEARISSEITGENSESVNTQVLDKILQSEKKIDFIKIDVEGHEMNVLKGSLKTIKNSSPIFLIEINGGINPKNENANSIIDLLKEFHYESFIRVNDKLQKVENESDGFNFFFLTPDHQVEFKTVIGE